MIWKSSVMRVDERARRLLSRQNAGRGWWPFAYSLLIELQEDWSPENEGILDRIYRSIRGGDGIYKMTHRNRFPEVDEQIARTAERYVGDAPVRIHDAAASNAITSLDLLRRLDEWFIARGQPQAPVTMLASDYYDHLDFVTVPGSQWTVAFDVNQQALQVIGRRILLSGVSPPSLRYPINRMAHLIYARRCIEAAAKCLREDIGVRRVPLFHPEALEVASRDQRFELRQHDVFQPTGEKFHIVRVMNLLTPGHLPESDVLRGVRASKQSLVPGGTFVFGRTMDDDDGRPCVTALEFTSSGPQIAWEVNGGAENRDLIVDYCRGLE